MSIAVGIPTRNRAELAMAAVDSVLRERLPDVTVVVSDNSTEEPERERLAAHCAGLPGVEYVRPPEPLPMAAHWNWLWATIDDRLAPRHVTYLTDRLVFAAGALRQLAGVVEREPERVVSYHWDHVEDLSAPVELVQRPWTGALLELDSNALIRLSSHGRFGDYLPRLMNCVAPASVMRAIGDRFGDAFGDIAPDYRFAYRCLAVCDAILYLDRACVIEQGMRRSAGINYLRGRANEDTQRFERELARPRFAATPEPGFETTANAIFDEYCSVRAELGGDRLPAPGRRGYLAANMVSADRIRDPDWRARQHELLARHGWTRIDRLRHGLGVGVRMAAYLAAHPPALARALKRQLWDRPPGSAAASLLARLGRDAPVRDELRFDTAAEAIEHAGAHPRPPQRHAFHVHELERAGAVKRRSSG